MCATTRFGLFIRKIGFLKFLALLRTSKNHLNKRHNNSLILVLKITIQYSYDWQVPLPYYFSLLKVSDFNVNRLIDSIFIGKSFFV